MIDQPREGRSSSESSRDLRGGRGLQSGVHGVVEVCRQGSSTSLITTLLELRQQGRFPFDELITHFPFERINAAMAAAEAGEVIKPVLRMP